MGCVFSTRDKVEPKEFNFDKWPIRAFSEESDDYKSPRDRITTDTLPLILHATFLSVFIGLMIYCISFGDIRRIINGYDNCGNICGVQNIDSKTSWKKSCERLDLTDKGYFLIYKPDRYHPKFINFTNNEPSARDIAGVPKTLSKQVERVCLDNCSSFPGYKPFLNRCILKKSKNVVDTFFGKSGLADFFEEASEDLALCWKEILYLCLVSLAFSILITILLRFLVGIVVWLVLIGVMIATTAGTIYLWILWRQSKTAIEIISEDMVTEIDSRRSVTYLVYAILATLITLGVYLIILVMRKRIELVIQLFREAGKALAAMPLLLFEPIITSLSLASIATIAVYCALWIESSGHEIEAREQLYVYEKDFAIKITRWYNILMALWMFQFVIGCQHMVIAGAVSVWYFTRNKENLGSPIFYSLHNLTRFHLGSVSLGSFLISLIQLARVLLTVFQKYLKTHEGKCVEFTLKCCHCCLYCLERILKYLTRNAYIEVAIYGYSFCQAGKQAFKLLTANALRVAAINSVGDFVLFLGKVLVIMATILVGIELVQKKEGVLHAWVPLSLAAIFAYLISHCFMSVYEMAIDTIFLCFCEDCERNDGVSRPYYMSRDLMEFVENSRKAMETLEMKNHPEALPTISGNIEELS